MHTVKFKEDKTNLNSFHLHYAINYLQYSSKFEKFMIKMSPEQIKDSV